MLKQILIRNFVLVDEVVLVLDPGLNVLTGETGAGKSIVVDAVGFLLGGRADRDLIRTGCDKAYVEGIFDVRTLPRVGELLARYELEPDEIGELMLSRELSASGRSTCRIMGVAVPLGALKQVAEHLMDIHGQHDHQRLLNESTHLEYLDTFGSAQHAQALLRLKDAYTQYAEADRAFQALHARSVERAERMALLTLQQQELSAAKLVPGEEEELTRARDLLRNADKVRSALETTYNHLYGADRARETALYLVRAAADALAPIAALGEEYAQLKERLDSAYYEIEDTALTARSLLDGVEAGGRTLEQTEERLDLLRRLGRKYGATVDDMLSALKRIEEELEQFATMDDTLTVLEDKRTQALARYRAEADKVSRSRAQMALALGERIEQQLAELNMKGTKIRVMVNREEGRIARDGFDSVQIWMAPNAGEPPRALARIASGGELSRVMLALKSISAEKSEIPAMVFDEIDTGISGHTAQAVAEKLWDTARYRQVLCVTHLQQIACMASRHFLVEKGEENGRTTGHVHILENAAREQEIARMLGGVREGRDSSLQHAQAMLQDALAYRKRNGGRGQAY